MRPSELAKGGAAEPPDGQYFDTARALAMFGSEQSFRKILQMAFDSLSIDVDKTGELLQRGDQQAASQILHGIKGFAPIFGGDALCARITALERSSKTDPIEQVRQDYAQLAPALSQWRDEMAHYLATVGSQPAP